MDIPHAAVELMGGHVESPALGVAAGAVSALSALRGFQNFQSGGTIHNIEGIGNLALAAASGLEAYEIFSGGEHGHHHHHSHGPGIAGTLEAVHGLAEITVGGLELKQGGRNAIGLTRIAKGAAGVAAALIPGAAPVGHLLHLGAAIALTAMDPTH